MGINNSTLNARRNKSHKRDLIHFLTKWSVGYEDLKTAPIGSFLRERADICIFRAVDDFKEDRSYQEIGRMLNLSLIEMNDAIEREFPLRGFLNQPA